LIGLRIAVIGLGRLGRALQCSLRRAGHRTLSVERSRDQLDQCRLDDLDVLCLAVRDDQIDSLVSELAQYDLEHKVALIFSGIKNLSCLDPLHRRGARIGRLHPLMAFSRAESKPFPGGTHFALAGHDEALGMSMRWVRQWQGVSHRIEEDDVVRYHLAAVLASNFLPLMIRMGAELLHPLAEGRAQTLDWLRPLVERSVEMGLDRHDRLPFSGPAVREDAGTLSLHREWLQHNRPEWLELYDQASRLIAEMKRSNL